MAVYESNATYDSSQYVWSAQGLGTFLAADSSDTRLVFENVDGTLTFLNGTGLSFNGPSVSWTNLTSVEHRTTGGLVLESIYGFDSVISSNSSAQVNNAFETFLSLDDLLIGYAGVDVMNGHGAVDTIYASGGADRLNGGEGDDIIIFTAPSQFVAGLVILGGPGGDTIRFEFSGALELIGHGEQLVPPNAIEGFDFTSSDGLNVHIDILTSGIDWRGAGVNWNGSDGVDRIVIDHAGAGVSTGSWTFDNWTSGVDTIIINGDSQLPSQLGDTLTGTPVNDRINGFGGNDVLRGEIGNDVLDGGADADAMFGGADNDVYIVDEAGDTANENPGEGIDGVVSSVTFTLATNVENLQLTGNANINATGNGDANRLIGNAGNNILNGMAGVDFMQGLGGNDVYWVDSLGESVVELAGQGIDGVVSTITYTLPVNVENLQLIGSANISGFGNAEVNRLIGNAGNNTLDGRAGADIMQGLGGNDVYWVDNVGDVVIEYGGGGIDGVISSINYTMTSGVENLQLGGASTIGVGNIYDNRITGNGLNNVLNGNLGYDVLIGAGGDDIFVFNSSITGGPNFDYLADFNDSGNDEIRLENAIYTALTSTGFLAANLFRDIGTGAQDADDVILYNSTTGALLYDSNGLAAGGVTQFAVVDVGTVITAADFFVI